MSKRFGRKLQQTNALRKPGADRKRRGTILNRQTPPRLTAAMYIFLAEIFAIGYRGVRLAAAFAIVVVLA